MSRVTAAGLIALFFCPFVQSCKTQNSSSTKNDPVADDLIITSRADSSLDLGYGIDAASMETRLRCIEEGNPNANNRTVELPEGANPQPQPGMNLAGDDEDAVYANCAKQKTSDACIVVKFCKDEAALNAALSTSLKASGLYQSMQLGGSSNSNASINSNSEKSYLVIKATYIKDVKDIDIPTIRPEIMSTLKRNNEESRRQFLATCGDKYVQFVSLGGELIAVAELKKGSREAKFAQENQISLKEIATGTEGSFSSSANIAASHSLMQTSVQVAETSGDEMVAMNLEEAIKKVQNFKKTINANPKPSIMSFGLQPYSTASYRDEQGQVQLINPEHLPLRAKVTTAFGKDHISYMFASLETAKKMRDHYQLLADYFPGEVNEAFGGDIKTKISELNEFIELATQAINECRNGASIDCEFPAFDKRTFESRTPDKLIGLMENVPQNRRPSGLYCRFDNGGERYIYDVWVHRYRNLMRFQYEAGFFGFNSPVYEIPFNEQPEFFTRYQANAISSQEIATFMNNALKRRSGASGTYSGGWGINSCYVK